MIAAALCFALVVCSVLTARDYSHAEDWAREDFENGIAEAEAVARECHGHMLNCIGWAVLWSVATVTAALVAIFA